MAIQPTPPHNAPPPEIRVELLALLRETDDLETLNKAGYFWGGGVP